MSDGFIILTPLGQDDPQIVMGIIVIRIQLQRFAKVLK